jgi:hypothetical protein
MVSAAIVLIKFWIVTVAQCEYTNKCPESLKYVDSFWLAEWLLPIQEEEFNINVIIVM